MSDGICFAGLDVHARKTAAAAVALGSGEVFKAQLSGHPGAAIEWLMTLPGEVRAVYEAGPTGFGLARAGRAAGIEVMVCSPGAIPRQPGDRIKTDTAMRSSSPGCTRPGSCGRWWSRRPSLRRCATSSARGRTCAAI